MSRYARAARRATTVAALAAAGVAATVSTAVAASPDTVPTSPAHSAPAPGHRYTIRYHDATGRLTSVWHGTAAAARARSLALAATHPAPGRRVTATPGTIQTPTCRPPTTYWVFHAAGLTCFAYGGTLSLHITGVFEVDSGNNRGYYLIGSHKHYLERFTSDFYASGQTVIRLHID